MTSVALDVWALIAAVLLMFGASFYLGMMLTMKLFLFPTWGTVRLDTLDAQMGIPVRRATVTFTYILPVMLAAPIVLVVAEWGRPTVLLAWGCLVGVLTLSVLSQLLQRPLNVKLYSGTIRTDEELQQVVRRWMDVSGVRFVAAGVTWVLTLWYIVARGGYFGVFA